MGVCQHAVPCAMVWCVACMYGVRAALMVATSTTSWTGWQTTDHVQLAAATSVNTRSAALLVGTCNVFTGKILSDTL